MADTNKTFVPADAFSTVDHDEYAAAEAQAKKSEGNYTLKLKKPFTYEGQTFDELNFDFEGLTGDDALAIEDASGHPRRIGDDALRALPIFEFNRVRGKARSFLLASEL